MQQKRFYVYGLFANNICFYIGKGTGNRKDHHYKNFLRKSKNINYLLYCKFISLQKANIIPESKILFSNLTERQALKKEANLIEQYGKKCTKSGTLCNILDGGKQPPSFSDLKVIKSKLELENIRKQQAKTCQNTIYQRNFLKIQHFKKGLKQNKTIKLIAEELNVSPDTLLRWAKTYNIKLNLNGKKIAIKEHLNRFRELTKKRVQPTSKEYTVLEPSGKITKTRKLVQYCKNKQIDYSNLRTTFKGKSKQHRGYKIIEVKEYLIK